MHLLGGLTEPRTAATVELYSSRPKIGLRTPSGRVEVTRCRNPPGMSVSPSLAALRKQGPFWHSWNCSQPDSEPGSTRLAARRPPQAIGPAATVGLGLVLFWTYGDRPLVGEPWQWADDGLYLRQAEAFVRWLHGDGTQWLGPYDALILAKAPLFSVWLGLLHVIHVPLRLAEFALLLSLPWLFRAAVRPVLALSSWQLAVIAVVLIALPFLPIEQRLLRSALQAALGGACLISAIGTAPSGARP